MARVLLVEDDESVSEGLATLLRLEGFDVDVLTEGRPVTGTIALARPDIVVLDLTLPDVDGITVARAVRDTWPALPVIISTGHVQYAGLPSLLRLQRIAFLQ